MSSSCISLSPTITKAPIITYSPVKNPEIIKRTSLIEKIQRRRHQYFKRIKKAYSVSQPDETLDGGTSSTKRNITAPCKFDMESERFASHIIDKAKRKMKRNSKRHVISPLPVTSKISAPIQGSRSSPQVKRHATVLPPLSPVEQHPVTPPRSMEYSKRYKEIQRKWHEDLQEQKHSTPVTLSPLLKSQRYVKTNNNVDTDQSINSSITTATDGDTSWQESTPDSKCKRRLTFTENLKHTKKQYNTMNTKEDALIASQLSTNAAHTSHYGYRGGRSSSYSQPSLKTTATDHLKLMAKTRAEPMSILSPPTFKQRRNTFTQEKPCVIQSKEQRELEYDRQYKMSLKLLQRTQIYALNAVMKELEVANFAKEMNKDQETVAYST